jgi:hypothetical protein
MGDRKALSLKVLVDRHVWCLCVRQKNDNQKNITCTHSERNERMATISQRSEERVMWARYTACTSDNAIFFSYCSEMLFSFFEKPTI